MTDRAETDLAPLAAALAANGPVRVWSLIVTVLGDAVAPRGGELWLGDLAAVVGRLGVDAGAVRTALTRLVADGVVERRKSGKASHVRLAAGVSAEFEAAEAVIYAAGPPAGDGTATLLVLAEPAATETAARLARAGFGRLSDGVFVAPGRREAPVPASRFVASEPPDDLATLAARAYRLDDLAAEFRRLRETLLPAVGALAADPSLPPLDALAARVALIHGWRRLALRDPRLPAAWLSADWPGEAVRAAVAGLYRRLAAASEAWLDAEARAADGPLPPAGPALARRFGSAHLLQK